MYHSCMGHLSFKIWLYFLLMLTVNVIFLYGTGALPREQSSWGQHGAHLGPVGPRWAPCWPHEPCYQGMMQILSTLWILIGIRTRISVSEVLSRRQVFSTLYMMTSSNETIFRITSPLCGEFTGHRWMPLTKASDTELWCFLWSAPE